MKLDIGSGPAPHSPEFTTVDLHHEADIRATMWSLPLPDRSVEEIWSSHALEHVPTDYVERTLAEWRRVLRPGGLLTLITPDLDYVARYWLRHAGSRRALDLIFGNQAGEGQYHQTGWNQISLAKTLYGAGFRRVRVTKVRSHGQESLRAIATS